MLSALSLSWSRAATWSRVSQCCSTQQPSAVLLNHMRLARGQGGSSFLKHLLTASNAIGLVRCG